MRKMIAASVAVAGLLLSLVACSSDEDTKVLKIGATPVPHAEILEYIDKELAPKVGLDLEITTFDDYTLPNGAVSNEELDANYFQHVPYLEEEKAKKDYKLSVVEPVHLEAYGIYSKKVKSLADVPEGAVVAIPDDPSNSGRALRLLADNGLLELKKGAGTSATKKDIVENPKNLEFKELAAETLPVSLDDTTLSVINGNFALGAKLKPSKDALALEKTKDNPYANVLVVRAGEEKDPRVVKLAKLLHSPEVKKYIEKKWSGAVLPAF